ncbi:MAG: glycosyltransferase [Candidatus Magasanikbacteria bacterium]|nr:glycosyltransferase [Candidatus Magasanikbacteria bacterium]
MKVVLVHDYLNEFGGAERVLLALSEIYPDAPIYTAFYREGSSAYKRFKDKKIITSWAQNVPFFASKLHSPLRFLAPFIWNSFDFSDYDLVIGSSNWYVTKGFKRNQKPETRNKKPIEICYCHTPPRYLYGYPTASGLQKYFLVRVYALLVNHFMRVYDFEAAQRVDWFIANSKEVAARIKKFYQRESTVIYPPVDVNRLSSIVNRKNIKTMNNEPLTMNNYFLVVSRLVGAKNVDIAVEVCTKLKLALKVVGTGRDSEKLETMAGETVEFLGDVDDGELVKLYQGCRALIFSGSQEDFGIVSVEAMAAGKPVIALAEGGVRETVIDGKTGLWVDDLASGAFVAAIKRFIEMEKKGQWDADFIRNHAQKFSKERFKREIKKFVESKIKKA